MFKKLIKNGTKLQNAWAFIITYLTECLEDYDNNETNVTEKLVWDIIENVYKNNKEFKEAYNYWVNKTNIVQAEDTLVLQLVVRTRCINSNNEETLKNFYKAPESLDYMEVIQFGKKLEYNV